MKTEETFEVCKDCRGEIKMHGDVHYCDECGAIEGPIDVMTADQLDTPTELAESTDLDRYEDVVFMQGDEAEKALAIIDQKGEEAGLEYLMQWHEPGNHMGRLEKGSGTRDFTFEKDGYTMSYNPSLGYVGLVYDLSYLSEIRRVVRESIRNR